MITKTQWYNMNKIFCIIANKKMDYYEEILIYDIKLVEMGKKSSQITTENIYQSS